MAPKKLAAMASSDSEESIEVKPKAKRKVGKVKNEKEGKKPAAKKAKTVVLTQPETRDDGWTLHPPSLIYRSLDGIAGTKVAAFDLDGTLAQQKSTMQMPRDADDWMLYNMSVPEKLKEVEDEGFKVVIFTNQGGIKTALTGLMAEKVTKRITNVLEALGMEHLPVVIATNKDKNRKPEKGMWDFWVEHGNSAVQPDKSQSYFVGDAAGRAGDFADSDKKFAENVGIAFKTSSDFFGKSADRTKASITGSSGFNDDMAHCFLELAAAQVARGDNPFGARATEKSANIIATYSSKITSGKELSKLPGVGKGTVAKIDEFLATNTLSGLIKDEAQEAEKHQNTDMALKFL